MTTFSASLMQTDRGDGYFRMLFSCMLGSLAMLAAASIASAKMKDAFPPWITILAGLAPLIYYHLFYLTPRSKNGLSQTAVDSVYYFGFLVTIAALGISAVSIARTGAADNINTIVYQFGVGLFATGYAIVARMHLSSVSRMLDDASPDAIIDKYIQRSKQLVDNLDLTLHSFSTLSEKSRLAIEGVETLSRTVLDRTEAVASRAQVLATKAVQDATKTFDEEVRSVLYLTKESLLEIRGLISDTSFTAEREELARSIKSTIEATTKLNVEFAAMERGASAGAEATQEAAIAANRLNVSLTGFDRNIAGLASADGSLPAASLAIASATETVIASAGQLQEIVTSLTAIARDATEGSSTHSRLARLVKKVDEELTVMAGASTRFAEVLERVQGAGQVSADTVAQLAQVTEILPRLAEGVAVLTERLTTVASRAEVAGQHIESLPDQIDRSRAAGEAVVSGMERLVAELQAATAQAAAFKSNADDVAPTFQAANRFLAIAATMEGTLRNINQSMGTLPSTLQAVEREMAESTAKIKSAVSSSSQMLAQDAQRSSEAAALLTAKLIEVAQVVIDRTRAHQAGGGV